MAVPDLLQLFPATAAKFSWSRVVSRSTQRSARQKNPRDDLTKKTRLYRDVINDDPDFLEA